MALLFNDFMGRETIHVEYKEFSFHKTGLPFDIKQAERYCETNEFEFDELVMTNLSKYIDQYVPKYASGFWNSNMKGEIYIGTNDYGIIKGIPCKKELDKKWVSERIEQAIRKYISGDADEIPSFQVEIISVEKKTMDSIHPDYLLYLDRKREFMEYYMQFLKEYQTWQQTYELVNMKLVDIVNIPSYRTVLIKYIESSDKRNETALKTLRDPTFLLPYMSAENMRDLKMDESNVFYWVTTFKDAICLEYKREKPIFSKKFKTRNTPFNLLTSVSDMIPYWIDIHLYLIHISFDQPKNKVSPYSYFNGNQWIQCNRIVDPVSNQPMCLPS
jgi:hypothetical protein